MRPSSNQFQVDPFYFRRYIILFQLVNRYFKNFNRTAMPTSIIVILKHHPI
jgi:hypothetical protein